MPFRFAFLVAVVLAGGLGVPRPADACSCLNLVSPCQAFGRNVVFVGVVQSVRTVGEAIQMKVRVTRGLKGITDGAEALVVSDVSSCGVRLRQGERYVIFAAGSPKTLQVHACTPPLSLAPGEPDPECPPVEGRVYGRVTRYDPARVGVEVPDRVSSVRLWLDLPSGRVTATSDAWGRFTFSGVPPGKYRIGVDAGPGLAPSFGTALDVLARSGCTNAHVTLEASGSRRNE